MSPWISLQQQEKRVKRNKCMTWNWAVISGNDSVMAGGKLD